MNETVPLQDLVCELPEELAIYRKNNGALPENLTFEPGYICVWEERFFVHTRVTIPFEEIDNGVGFGLWVEISKEDFGKYMEAEKDDDKYMAFEAKGMIANHWPGFQNLYGLIVTIKAINVTEKIYITQVSGFEGKDPGFDAAMQIQKGEVEKIEELRKRLFSQTV